MSKRTAAKAATGRRDEPVKGRQRRADAALKLDDPICDCGCPCANRVKTQGLRCYLCLLGHHAPDLNGDTDDGEDYAEGFWT